MISTKEFQKTVYKFYEKNRRDLPWRRTDDPYAILVSEIMLQQTQVDRVIPRYLSWIKRFPSARELADASFPEVLKHWSGLGYNRRAQYLHQCAIVIMTKNRGIFPRSAVGLQKLPGVGWYTAQAIRVFAYNQPVPVLETNIRTVYIHHFFPESETIDDKELLPLVEQTLDPTDPRKWFNALMDYGAYLKSNYPNPSRRSKQYVKQAPLKGSVREVRGWILKQLTAKGTVTMDELHYQFINDPRIDKAIAGLEKDHMIKTYDQTLILA